jgi:hypothetical protein
MKQLSYTRASRYREIRLARIAPRSDITRSRGGRGSKGENGGGNESLVASRNHRVPIIRHGAMKRATSCHAGLLFRWTEHDVERARDLCSRVTQRDLDPEEVAQKYVAIIATQRNYRFARICHNENARRSAREQQFPRDTRSPFAI